MKQLLNSFNDGKVYTEKVSKPTVRKNEVLISNLYSALSIGTERMLVDFGRGSYIQKVRQQPEKVKEVINKVKTDGLSTTYNAVKSKLDQPIPLGYSSVGRVIEIGEDIDEFKVGDLVVSNGPHSELVSVNKNLVAKVPDGVKVEDSAFTVISSIPLQGVRLLEPEIGETVVVMGLGLTGLIACQLLIANGCNVIGTDLDPKKIEIAKSYGVDAININDGIDVVSYVRSKTATYGADKVLITASTKSNEPMQQAAEMVRKRGKVVLVGVVGLELNRTPFYEKEITFQVSSSYGPGRYDKQYEEQGIDYPFGYVRWTENRNFQAILNLLKNEKLSFDSLITHRVDFENASVAYNELSENKNVIGALFKYDYENVDLTDTVKIEEAVIKSNSDVVIGIIGAGNYTNQTLLPRIDDKHRLKKIVSSGGLNAKTVGKKHGFEESSSNTDTVFEDTDINTVIITTRHNTHADFVIRALEENKAVFVEKPLALTIHDLERIKKSYANHHLMVGFNRRFAPTTEKMKQLLDSQIARKNIIIDINAGHIPADHWTQDPSVGGGRLIGEACHFIDLAMFLIESEIVDYKVAGMETDENTYDTFSILLTFADGSIASINYYSNGNKAFPKETITASVDNKILVLDNFKSLKGYGFKDFKILKSRNQDKGHEKCINTFLSNLKSSNPLIPFSQIMEVSRISIELDSELRKK